MIPKSTITKSTITPEAAERAIDAAIDNAQMKGDARIGVELVPIKYEDLVAVTKRYEAGGWTVKIENLRTPDGYHVRLT